MQFFGLIMPYRRIPRPLNGFCFFREISRACGLSWSCLVLLLSLLFLLGRRRRKPRRTTKRTHPASPRNIPRNRLITPRLPTPAVITPRTTRRRRIQAKSTIRSTRVTAEKKLRVRGSIVAMSPQRNSRGRINCTMLLLPPLNCDLWRSS